MYRWIVLLLLASLPARQGLAEPVAERSDIGIRKVLDVSARTMRIAHNPSDGLLYTLTATGAISRIVEPQQDPAEKIALGRFDAQSQTRVWTVFDARQQVPAGVPIEAIREAVAGGVRRATDPTSGQLHILADNGDILTPPRTVVVSGADHGISPVGGFHIGADGTFYVALDTGAGLAARAEVVASSADHGLGDTQGFDIGADGTFYVGGNERAGEATIIHVMRGSPDGRTWTRIARTEPIPLGTKNHPHPAIVLSPDERFVYINSGSRTDHGELAEMDGQFPGLREAPLSSAILRVPADGSELVIPADGAALAASGFFFADGFRNAFDMAFAANGDLFAADNGPDSDIADELCWVQQGRHYGFPWRMGAMDNPQRFSDYDPAADPLIETESDAKRRGLFYNDPTYPPPPAEFADPVVNLGPDADRYRDPVTGEIRDASERGETAHTFTPHSSPLGVVFDVQGALSDEFRYDGFALRIGGDCCNLINPFNDPDEDLLHLDLEKREGRYEARITRLVGGFNGPIDAEIVGHRIYVVEWGGRGLWEVSLPEGSSTAVEEEEGRALPEYSGLGFNFPNPFNATTLIPYRLDAAQWVEVDIYSPTGQKVRTLVRGARAAGAHAVRWDGRDERGLDVASGAYIYRLRAGDLAESRVLTLVK